MSNFSSGRPSRLKSSRYLKPRESNSPTLTSSRSDRSLWARSYKNEPMPTKLRARIIGHKYDLDDDQDSDDQIVAVEEEQEQQNMEKKRSILPKFKVISDWGEFSDTRKNRIKSQRKPMYSPMRCQSVSSLKLPQVLEQKKQEDQHWRKCVSKLAQFRDNNEFGQNYKTRRSSSEYTDVVSRVQSSEAPARISRQVYPQEIMQIDAEETKSVKLPNQKSIITAQLQKIIVDELDERKKKKQQFKQDIQSIIEEQKHEQQFNTEKLRQSLSKFESESGYLSNDELRYSGQQDKDEQLNQDNSKIQEEDDSVKSDET